jgi:hypothetical protein
MIHSTGKTAKRIRINAITSRSATLKRFWNFCDERRV